MIFGLGLFSLPDVVGLPQRDSDPKSRAAEVKENKHEYEWDYTLVRDAPMVSGVPHDEWPAYGWVEGMLKNLFRVTLNGLALRFRDSKEEFFEEKKKLLGVITAFSTRILKAVTWGKSDREEIQKIAKDIGDLFGVAEGTGLTLQEYKDLFHVYKPDKVAHLDQFLRDDIFGWYRVAGPSPLRIRLLTNPVATLFPELNDTILRSVPHFEGDTLAELVRDKRLFYIDYEEFDGAPTGSINGTLKEGFYLYAPTALLAVPKKVTERCVLLPLAIRCGQGWKYPMYTPSPKHTNATTWLAAKCCVQVADAVLHEARYHLGLTHLLLERFVVAMRRTLSDNHPLSRLMQCHFEGTIFINLLGATQLASPGGVIDQITAPPIELTVSLCVASMQDPFRFNDVMPEKELEKRGLFNAPQLHYPYREDGLKLWAAIQEWVCAYVSAYYKSDTDVVEDFELAAWCREITDEKCGSVLGFGENGSGEVKSRAYLIRFISALIYVASVQHAAVNFPQGSHMQFVPAMPLAGFAPPPTTAKPFESQEDWVAKMLPTLKVAKKQLDTAEMLSGFQWTALGEYGRDLNFAPDEVTRL